MLSHLKLICFILRLKIKLKLNIGRYKHSILFHNWQSHVMIPLRQGIRILSGNVGDLVHCNVRYGGGGWAGATASAATGIAAATAAVAITATAAGASVASPSDSSNSSGAATETKTRFQIVLDFFVWYLILATKTESEGTWQFHDSRTFSPLSLLSECKLWNKNS